MKIPDFDKFPSIKIPEQFYSNKTGASFSECLVCHIKLGKDVDYIIEKVIRQQKTEYEYAMCLNCCEKMFDMYSEESRRKTEEYFLAHVDFMARYFEFMDEDRVEPWIKECIFHKQPIESYKEYQLCGLCRGEKLILGNLPFAVSFEAMDEMQLILSKKTKGYLDHFFSEFFDVPEGANLPTRPHPVLL